MEELREIGTIWRGELARAVRSPRTLALVLLYAFFSLLVLIGMGVLLSAASDAASANLAAAGATDEAQSQVALKMREALLGWLFGADARLVESLIEIPLLVPLVFKITLFFLPMYAALVGFDQLSAEIERRSIRYLAVRARRSSILFGKFLAQATVLVVLILGIQALVFVFARATNPDFGFGLAAVSLLRFWVAALVFTVAYAALTSLCSALFTVPAVSLVFNLVALFGFWLLDAIGSWIAGRAELEAITGGSPEAPWYAGIRHLSPSAYSTGLLHPELPSFLASVGAYALFAAVFLGLGYLVLRRRDI